MTDEVLIFITTGSAFAKELGDYLKQHPTKRVVAIAPQTVDGYTWTNIVVVREGLLP